MEIKIRLARTASSGEDVQDKTQARSRHDCWINRNKFKKLTFKKHQRPVKALRSRKTFFREERTITSRTYNHQLFFSLILTNPKKPRTENRAWLKCRMWLKRKKPAKFFIVTWDNSDSLGTRGLSDA